MIHLPLVAPLVSVHCMWARSCQLTRHQHWCLLPILPPEVGCAQTTWQLKNPFELWSHPGVFANTSNNIWLLLWQYGKVTFYDRIGVTIFNYIVGHRCQRFSKCLLDFRWRWNLALLSERSSHRLHIESMWRTLWQYIRDVVWRGMLFFKVVSCIIMFPLPLALGYVTAINPASLCGILSRHPYFLFGVTVTNSAPTDMIQNYCIHVILESDTFVLLWPPNFLNADLVHFNSSVPSYFLNLSWCTTFFSPALSSWMQ